MITLAAVRWIYIERRPTKKNDQWSSEVRPCLAWNPDPKIEVEYLRDIENVCRQALILVREFEYRSYDEARRV